MAIVTTYICDISGKQGNEEDFVSITIQSVPLKKKTTGGFIYESDKITHVRLVHKDVADKLKLFPKSVSKEDIPTPTFESQLSSLLKDYIADLVYDEVADQMSYRN